MKVAPDENTDTKIDDQDMGIKPPHLSDDELRMMIAEARQEKGIDGKESKKNIYKALGL